MATAAAGRRRAGVYGTRSRDKMPCPHNIVQTLQSGRNQNFYVVQYAFLSHYIDTLGFSSTHAFGRMWLQFPLGASTPRFHHSNAFQLCNKYFCVIVCSPVNGEG